MWRRGISFLVTSPKANNPQPLKKMEKRIEDYLKFYLNSEAKIRSTAMGIIHPLSTYTENTINRFQNHEWELILRPLSDMTEEERQSCIEFMNHDLDTWIIGAKRTAYLLSRGFDLFGLLDCRLAIDKTTLNK